MQKKLLLSTILSSVVLSSVSAEAAPPAPGAQRTEAKTSGGQFTVGDTTYTDSTQLIQGVVKNDGEAVKLDAAGAAQVLDDLTSSTAATKTATREALRDQIVARDSSDTTEVGDAIDAVFDKIEAIDTKHGSGFANYFFDTSELLSTDLAGLQKLEKHVESYSTVIDSMETVEGKFVTRRTELAAGNSQLQELDTELTALEAKLNAGTITDEEVTRASNLEKQLYADKGFADVRNSSDTQDTFKQNIAQIKAARSSDNSLISDSGNQSLETLKDDLAKYMVLEPEKTDVNSLPPVQQPDNVASDTMVGGLDANRSVIDSRVSDLSGIASGDLMETYGVWAKGTITSATQKAHGNSQGYKLVGKGVTIGVDTGDESLIGLAYSFFKNDAKNKTVSTTTDKISSHIVNAYGKYAITPEVFVSGQAQYGFSEVKKSRATGDAANNVATAKPDGKSMGAKIEFGYDYAAMPEFHVLPTLGLAHSKSEVDSYTETGNGLNRSVGKIKTERSSGIAGVTAKYFVVSNGMKFAPELHANIDFALKSKNTDTAVTVIDGIDAISTPAQKQAKQQYNVGTSLMFAYTDAVEFTAGYDYGFAKKYQSHTGTLKVRVNL